MKIYIVSDNVRAAREYASDLGALSTVGRGYGDAQLIFVHRWRDMQGRMFENGDEVHYLYGWGQMAGVDQLEEQIRHASAAWSPTRVNVGPNGVAAVKKGFETPPPLDNRAALENWLAS